MASGPGISARDMTAPPNLVSLVRVLLIPVVLVLLATGQRSVALVVLAAAVLTDGLDGFLARRLDRVTELGKILDPVADKLIIDVVLGALAFRGEFPFWALTLIVARDVGIIAGAAAVAGRVRSVPPAAWIGKVTLAALAATAMAYVADLTPVERPLLFATVGLVIASGVWYAALAARTRTETG